MTEETKTAETAETKTAETTAETKTAESVLGETKTAETAETKESVLGAEAKTEEEKKAAEDKAKAEAAAAEVKIEDLKLPEGFKMEESTAKELKDVLGNKELSAQDRMQKLTDIHTNLLKQHAESQVKLWNETQEKWVTEIKADPEIGGPNFQKMQQTVSKALDQFGTPKVREALNYTGAGNNPEIVKTFFKMASALVEGGIVKGGNPAPGPKSAAETLWPTQQGT